MQQRIWLPVPDELQQRRTVIFSSWALSDFSKSSCFFSRASTLSRESPRSSFSRNAWTQHTHHYSSGSHKFPLCKGDYGRVTTYFLFAHPVVNLFGVSVEELQVHALLILLSVHLPQLQQRLLLLAQDLQLQQQQHRTDRQTPAEL